MNAIDTSTKDSAKRIESSKSNGSSRELTNVPSHAVLQVMEGVHEGVSMPLVKSAYSIGCKPGVDIMLADSGIAPEHGIVRLHGSAVLVEAAGGEIGVGKRCIPHGHGCRVTLPVELKFGTAIVKIARNRSDGSPWRSRRMVYRGAAIAGIGFAMLVPLSGFDTDAAITRLSLVVPSDAIVSPFQLVQGSVGLPSGTFTVASTGSAAAPGVDPNVIAEALATKLREAGLGHLVTKMEGIRTVVSGVISHEQVSAWSEVQRWFDRTYGAHFILASAVEARAPSGNPRFDLQAISYSETPYVITGDGQRRYPGAILDQGWVIKDIHAGRLTLVKDGKELALSF
jgi:hypothetical protein